MDREIPPSGPILDLKKALARLGDDRELFADMVGYLLEDAPKLQSELRQAVAVGDAWLVRMKAHALKGLIASCGGERAKSVAQSLEDAGQAGELRRADQLIESLDVEVAALMRALAEVK